MSVMGGSNSQLALLPVYHDILVSPMQDTSSGILLGFPKKTWASEVQCRAANKGVEKWIKLEQLERLRSELPPAAPWLPILVIHIRSQSQTNKTKSKLQI